MRRRWPWAPPAPLAAALLLGCAGAPSRTEPAAEPPIIEAGAADAGTRSPAPPEPADRESAAAQPDPPMTEAGEIRRPALARLLERGPAALLAMVSTRPFRQGGRFAGFELRAFHTPLPAGLDLRPGDVLITVNGLRIAAPDDFFHVFESLQTAQAVRLELLREGTRAEHHYPIVN